MKYILTLDQGTTSSRAIVFDAQGQIKAMAQQEFRQHFPQPGWVEHNPEEIWTSQLEVARQALKRARIGAERLAALGITNQRETVIVWERNTGKPLCNAIVWQDRRTAQFCDELRADGAQALVREKTGLRLDPYFSGTKLRWILDHVPDARRRAQAGELAFGTVDSWLVWKLTEGRCHLTDASNASRTLLYNIHTKTWDDELLKLFEVPRALLPEVRPSSEVIAHTAPVWLGASVPVAGIAGDQQAALFGQACTAPGLAKNTYGTGCFLLMNTGTTPVLSQHNLLTTVAWQVGDEVTYALEGSVFVAGAAVQWLRDGLGMIETAAEVEALAAEVPDTEGVYFVPAFSGLGAPHWDPYARGALLGLSRGTTRAHIARAALEGIAYQVVEVLEAMEADARLHLDELRVDGGAAVNNLLLQFQADVLGADVVRAQTTEATALGAAYLAGLAVGYWKDSQEIAEHWRAERTFHPTKTLERVEALKAGWHKALERAKGWES